MSIFVTTTAEQFVEELSCLCVLLWTDSAAMRAVATMTTTTQAVLLLHLSFFRDVTNAAQKKKASLSSIHFSSLRHVIVRWRRPQLMEACAEFSERTWNKSIYFYGLWRGAFPDVGSVRVPFHPLWSFSGIKCNDCGRLWKSGNALCSV